MDRTHDDENWKLSCLEDDDQEKDEEEEALSLCDLPVTEMRGEKQLRKEAQTLEAEEDFQFGSWDTSLSTEPEMCAADDVFFKGQILPLRFSVSSDNGLPEIRQDSRNPSGCASRSESMEHNFSVGFTSASSRSSSIRSRNSSSSSSSIIAIPTTTTTSSRYKPRVRNQFHTYPSPKPQIPISGARPGNVGSRCRRSTRWGLFRLGLVRTPEIELQDLKLRSKSGGSSSTSRSNSYSGRNSSDQVNVEKKRTQRFLEKSGFSSCKCSVNAVETVPSKIVIVKSNNNNKNDNNRNSKMSGREVKEEQQKPKQKQQQQQQQRHGKQTMSHHRTFEWLKQLSIADVPQEA